LYPADHAHEVHDLDAADRERPVGFNPLAKMRSPARSQSA
jgi:hypothetical protein